MSDKITKMGVKTQTSYMLNNNTKEVTPKTTRYLVYRYDHTVTEKFDYGKYQRYKARQNGFFAIASFGLILVFITFFFRSFANPDIEQNISTLLLQVLRFFGENTVSTEYLMWTLNNFSNISHWFGASNSTLVTALGDIAEAFGYLSNIVLLLTALLLQAINILLLLLNILFVPSV